jgi:hypothetical protein
MFFHASLFSLILILSLSDKNLKKKIENDGPILFASKEIGCCVMLRTVYSWP